jgi:hypothetical protein
MSCTANLIEILNVDFTSTFDEGNWNHDSTNPLQTTGGFLVVNPSSATTIFTRNVSNSLTNNSRLRVRLNFKVEKTDPNGPNEMQVRFQLFNEGVVIHESCVDFSNLSDSAEYSYFLDRTYKILNPISTLLSFRIIVPVGWEHKVFLENLIIDDYNFCENNIRTYFSLEEIIENALIAQSGTIDLMSWKVDGVETLTPSFFAENLGADKVPNNAWKFAKARPDGTNRVEDNIEPNSFNPFQEEFGLQFDTVGSYYGGKPIATLTGSDYGTGLFELGFEKPIILNGNLETKRGVFFIDIDYSVSLKIEFKIVLNYLSQSTFKWPNQNRQYLIEWNADTCEKKFYYDFNDENGVTSRVDQMQNGFLSGVTPVETTGQVVQCDESFSPSGVSGSFSYQLDFGVSTGITGINYNAYSVPDKFIINWNGEIYDTGYVGDNENDNRLINAGVDPSDINTGSPSTGEGQLLFNKTTAFPTTATITVLAPLPGTRWIVTGLCPGTISGSPVGVSLGQCNDIEFVWIDAYISNLDPLNYTPTNGDVIYADSGLTTPYNGGNNEHRMRINNFASPVILDYSFDIATNGVISNVTPCVQSLLPSLTEISNVDTGAGGTRTQIFEVGSVVDTGNRFVLSVYGVNIEVTAIQSDDPDSIAVALRDLINSTSEGEWNAEGQAPTPGANGFPPNATSSGNQITITLNFENEFNGSAFVS